MSDPWTEIAKALAAPLIVGSIAIASMLRHGRWRVPVAVAMVVAGAILFACVFRALGNPWVQIGIASGMFVVVSTAAHLIGKWQEQKFEDKEMKQRQARDRREDEERKGRMDREDAEREERSRRMVAEEEERKCRWEKEDKRRRMIFKISGWSSDRRNAVLVDTKGRLKTEKDPKEIAALTEMMGIVAEVELDYRKAQKQ